MQYIDVNGRIGTRMLVGASGKTYGNIELLTDAEKTEAILDGILIYIPPTPPTPDPADVKRQATAQIIKKAEEDMSAIASVSERIGLLAETLTLIKEAINIPPAKQAKIDALEATHLRLKAIRDKAKQDIDAL